MSNIEKTDVNATATHSISTPSKIFIIGLPRTGTTSVCVSLLNQGYKVAHTAYVQKAFDDAQVIADTPIYYHYQYLDKKYPHAKFVYLQRDKLRWIPSIKQLLNRMSKNLLRDDGGFNLSLKECYLGTFSPFTVENITSDDFLSQCYDKHQQGIDHYFSGRESDLLKIDISQENSLVSLLSFLNGTDNNINKNSDKYKSTESNAAHCAASSTDFPHYNAGGKVTAWKDIKHENKIESTIRGRSEKLIFK